MKPLFILSLPRSGSTLLQRMLSANTKIASTAEPWILLPLVYSLKKEGTLTTYFHTTAQVALEDFVNNLPNGIDDYRKKLNIFVSSLYSLHAGKGKKYFLDKTPRYYEIIDDIVKIFPEAKFIFLFRNPIQVYASVLTTWGNNSFFDLNYHFRDITSGYSLIMDGYEKYKSISYAAQYEDLIKDPELELNKICEYLNIDFQDTMTKNFSEVRLKGKMGDKIGVFNYQSVSKEPLEKWKLVFGTLIRKKILIKYINKLDHRVFELGGYNKQETLEILNKLPNRLDYIFKDIAGMLSYIFKLKSHSNILLDSELGWTKNKFLY